MRQQEREEQYHFIGIGGIGMSALARIVKARQAKVSGSDLHQTYITQQLVNEGIDVHLGHSARWVPREGIVIYSSDVKATNEEMTAARHSACRLWHRSELLEHLMQGYQTLAITGTHGKTTTTGLLAHVLLANGRDPSFAIGGILLSHQTNGRHGTSPFFVAEADESDGSFLRYTPFGAIVTNVEREHLSHYGSEAALHAAFQQFFKQVQSAQHLFWCGDDPLLRSWHPAGISYGVSEGCALKISDFRQEGWEILFSVDYQGKRYEQIRVALTGWHNALNSAAVFGLALALGLNEQEIRKGLSTFPGLKRRCETKAVVHGVRIIDDYGHHPTEIKATLKALREAAPTARLIAVFQPHRYSRVQDLLSAFGPVFNAADLVLVTDIYAAGEEPIAGVTTEALLQEIRKQSYALAHRVPLASIPQTVANVALPGDLVVTFGAGDVTYVGTKIAERLTAQPPQKLKIGLIGGGKSSEHAVSLMSCGTIQEALQPERYEVEKIGITRSGIWLTGEKVFAQLAEPTLHKEPVSREVLETLYRCDVLMPVLHGQYAEDGRIQGFLDTLQKPYVGCEPCAGAVSMDKVLCKRIALTLGIATAEFVDFSYAQWQERRPEILQQIQQTLPFPVFVKPIHLGSTIGLRKVHSFAELAESIDYAFHYDMHVVVERGLVGRELEFGVLGNEFIAISPPAEVMTGGEINTYDGKYSSKTGFEINTRPILSEELIAEGQRQAGKIYETLGCVGLARVDFFLDKDQKYWFNEINPFPGCTHNSAFPKIWQTHGFPMQRVVDRLILLSLERQRSMQRVFALPKGWDGEL